MSMKVSKATEYAVIIENMSKWFDDFQVLININLSVRYGERVVICGPSGSGKSTLIRCLNHLEVHQQGTPTVADTTLFAGMKNPEKIRREVGMVFQSFNLFPHLSVLDNCVLPQLRSLGRDKATARETGMKFLQWVNVFVLHKTLGGQLNELSQKWLGQELPRLPTL